MVWLSLNFHIGTDKAITPAALAEATRHGRTMVTTGPLVQFDIDGQISGSTLPPDGQQRTVTIKAHYPQHAFSLAKTDSQSGESISISRIELIRNGEVVEHWEPRFGEATITHMLTETGNCWYIVRVFGGNDRWQVALTNPIDFATQAVSKRTPLTTLVRGRIYDFVTGQERAGTVEIQRHGAMLRRFSAKGQFQAKIPLDADRKNRSRQPPRQFAEAL